MPALLKTTQIQEASSATVNLTLGTDGTITTGTNMTVTGTAVMSSPYTMRNKIINGAMVIDQRNAGAAVNANGGNYTFPVDRFYSQVYNTTGNTTGQQSSTAPSGFANSMKISVQTADTSVGASDQVWYGQTIEGYNTADLAFGTASASSFTLSFWVYSSVTGTYCVCFKNSAQNRAYVSEYTISAANTWERKTITVSGDTSGTWLTNNGAGLYVWFVLMAGSSVQTTPNVWSSAAAIGTSNQVNFMSSTSNTWYVTGVQLERGTVATPFEYRNYQQELAMCQRYYEQSYDYGTVAGAATYSSCVIASGTGSPNLLVPATFKVTKRAAPTVVVYSAYNGASGNVSSGTTNYAVSSSSWGSAPGTNSFGAFNNTNYGTNNYYMQFTASAEL